MTLPSNASMKLYPSNTVAQYQTLLPQRIELEGKWEVGLVEFSYPVSWYNIGPEEWFQMHAFSWDSDFLRIDVGEGKMFLKEGHYGSAAELIQEMKSVWTKYWSDLEQTMKDRGVVTSSNKKTVPAGTQLSYIDRATMQREDEHMIHSMDYNSLRFEFNEKTHRVKLHLKYPEHHLEMSPNLQDILAIRKKNFGHFSYSSETEIDLNRARHNIFVYCDVIEDNIVGDVRAPLLRSTTVRGHYGEDVREIYNKPMYIPIKTNSFDTVEISIKSECGELIPFNYGNSCVTLHFRRVVENPLLER